MLIGSGGEAGEALGDLVAQLQEAVLEGDRQEARRTG